MKDIVLLAIESSCDETAAAVVRNGREVLSNVIYSQIALHTQYGGVVPEIASRKHIEKINQVITQALDEAEMTLNDLDGIAVTYGPGLVGALLVGVSEAKAISFATGLPLISEIMSIDTLDLFEDVDIIQVGARNMQNFDLLKELGHLDRPILLKRGIAGTLKELLMSAEYIMAGGNEEIILCERGIRTYETMTRNTLDLSAVPVLQERTHLPVVVDPSHATGQSRLVPPMALAAAAAGADGIMVEVHNDPAHALCDGAQSLTPEQFDDLAKRIRRLLEAMA